MMPATRKPRLAKQRVPIELKLKPGWRFDPRRQLFESARGERFSPRGTLPKKTRTVLKVPHLARAGSEPLSPAERDLQRYLQVILPAGEPPLRHLETVRGWPAVETADVAPDVSLPGGVPTRDS